MRNTTRKLALLMQVCRINGKTRIPHGMLLAEGLMSDLVSAPSEVISHLLSLAPK